MTDHPKSDPIMFLFVFNTKSINHWFVIDFLQKSANMDEKGTSKPEPYIALRDKLFSKQLLDQRVTQDDPRVPQEAPRAPQGAPRAPQEHPKSDPRRPKSTPRDPKSTPRGPKSTPRAPQEQPKATQEHPKRPQDHPKSNPIICFCVFTNKSINN